MTLPNPLRLKGLPASPYTRKMLAVLRYRRIPYALVFGAQGPSDDGLPKPKVDLLPTFYFPGEDGALTAVVDSTPIIRRLETEVSGRSVIPTDPVLAFLDYLLEDYGDEWLTKAMFHFRWAHPPDIERAAKILPRWSMFEASEEELEAVGRVGAAKQIDRLRVVGSNATTGPIIEESYARLLDALGAHLLGARHVLGSRPSACDFALYGQLTQLVTIDPTSAALSMERSPRVVAWVDLVEDLSGLEPAEDGWFDRDAIPDTLPAILTEVGRTYVPVMVANRAALRSGATEVRTVVGGKPWVQQPFPYQGKSLEWVRGEYAALSAADRQAVDAVLAGTGCEALFA